MSHFNLLSVYLLVRTRKELRKLDFLVTYSLKINPWVTRGLWSSSRKKEQHYDLVSFACTFDIALWFVRTVHARVLRIRSRSTHRMRPRKSSFDLGKPHFQSLFPSLSLSLCCFLHLSTFACSDTLVLSWKPKILHVPIPRYECSLKRSIKMFYSYSQGY